MYMDYARDMRGCLSVLGMMVLGAAIAEIKNYKHDWLFVAMAFIAQFILWPIIIVIIIMIDKNYFHFYTTLYYQSFFLLSLIPIGINLIAYASQLKVQPEKAAFTTLLSTIFAMVHIPVMIALFIRFIG
jgi:predicted permease